MDVEKKAQAEEETSAPYNSQVARLIASASGMVVMGILCCGDMAVAFLKFLKNKMPNNKGVSDVSPEFTRRIHWVKTIAKMVEWMAMAIPSGVAMLTGYVASVLVNSKPAKKLINILPGEIVGATLDASNKIGNAVGVARKNVVSTLSGATTQLVSESYGDNAARATDEGLEAAGHTFGAATAFSNIPTSINPTSVAKASPDKKQS